MSRDPNNYPDPETFNPDRFAFTSSDPRGVPRFNSPMDPHDFVFGFGRRRCPGQELADANIFIAMAMSLAVFDILPMKEGGLERPPVAEFISGTVRYVYETQPFVFNSHD